LRDINPLPFRADRSSKMTEGLYPAEGSFAAPFFSFTRVFSRAKLLFRLLRLPDSTDSFILDSYKREKMSQIKTNQDSSKTFSLINRASISVESDDCDTKVNTVKEKLKAVHDNASVKSSLDYSEDGLDKGIDPEGSPQLKSQLEKIEEKEIVIPEPSYSEYWDSEKNHTSDRTDKLQKGSIVRFKDLRASCLGIVRHTKENGNIIIESLISPGDLPKREVERPPRCVSFL